MVWIPADIDAIIRPGQPVDGLDPGRVVALIRSDPPILTRPEPADPTIFPAKNDRFFTLSR